MEAWSGRGVKGDRRHRGLAETSREVEGGVLWAWPRGGGTPAAVFPEQRCSHRRFQAQVWGLPALCVEAMVLFPVIGKLLHKRVVLASASPRRREILSNAVRSGPGRGGGRGREGPNQLGPATQDPYGWGRGE
ncbi:hypothetical protein P7K49_037924 [Saguinus oedipus]|uniref:Uncharacterized protein n=1 Tax=Saguinus oedipus TaxID=9490 RepID=A0ABQ9TE15_SAGOE|nr:hypothetical protein P7K49_037924 [Saguinus oedipus]